MFDISLSIIAWISVVLIQAIIHYVVFGVRRARIQQEEEIVLEESLSLATTEGSVDFPEEPLSPYTNSETSVYHGNGIASMPSTPNLLLEKSLEDDESEEFLTLLSQTGSEMLKRRSFERLVQEQIMAVPQ